MRQYKSVREIEIALDKARQHCKMPGQVPGLLLDEDDLNPLIKKLSDQAKQLQKIKDILTEVRQLPDRERQRSLADQFLQSLLAIVMD